MSTYFAQLLSQWFFGFGDYQIVCGFIGYTGIDTVLARYINLNSTRCHISFSFSIDQTLCDTICNDTQYSPVCGTDKKWYRNKCELTKTACSSKPKLEVASNRALCSNSKSIKFCCSTFMKLKYYMNNHKNTPITLPTKHNIS